MKVYEGRILYSNSVGDCSVRVEDSRYGENITRSLHVSGNGLNGCFCYGRNGQDIYFGTAEGEVPRDDWFRTFIPIVDKVMSSEDQEKWLPSRERLSFSRNPNVMRNLDGTIEWSPDDF